MEVSDNFPTLASVFAAIQVAVAAGQLRVPCGDEDIPGICGIDDDVVQHHLGRVAGPGKARPACALVRGKIKTARAGTEKNSVRIFWINGQAAHGAAVRTNRLPWLLCRERSRRP